MGEYLTETVIWVLVVAAFLAWLVAAPFSGWWVFGGAVFAVVLTLSKSLSN